MRLILFFLLIALLSACSSNLKKGNNMMEAEQYDEAVRYYEKALQEDPGDGEIEAKLFEARTRMVMANLIKVRLLRQSQQYRSASLLLNASLRNIDRWKIVADSGVKATIQEEVQAASKWLDAELKAMGERAQHNQFYYSLKQFNYILDSGYADRTIQKFRPSMRKKGQAQCQQMENQLTGQTEYLHDVWLAYCSVFDLQVNYPLAQDNTRFRTPVIDHRQTRISKDAQFTSADLADSVVRSIKHHPWFSDRATQSLPMSMSGRVTYRVDTKPKVFEKVVMVYDETLELVKDPENPDKVIRRLIHRNKVPKSVTFKGREYEERYAHSVVLKTGSVSLPIDARAQQAEQKVLSPSHTTYFKEQGIRPLKATLLNKQVWQRSIAQNLINQAISDLDRAWVERYCSDQSNLNGLTQNEYAARCALFDSSHPIVKAWSQAEFSLTFEQLEILLSGNDA